MASHWGNSWGTNWAHSWDYSTVVADTHDGDVYHEFWVGRHRENEKRRKHREEEEERLEAVQEEIAELVEEVKEQPAKPTPAQRKDFTQVLQKLEDLRLQAKQIETEQALIAKRDRDEEAVLRLIAESDSEIMSMLAAARDIVAETER